MNLETRLHMLHTAPLCCSAAVHWHCVYAHAEAGCCVWLAHRIFKNAAGQGPSDAQLEAILDRSAMLAQMAEKAGQQEGQKDKGRKEAAGTSAAGVYRCSDPCGPPVSRACGMASLRLPVHAFPGNVAMPPACECLQHTPTHCWPSTHSGCHICPPAAAAGAADDDGALVAAKHSALEFDAALPPVSSYMLDGIDYQQLKKIKASSLSDIAR